MNLQVWDFFYSFNQSGLSELKVLYKKMIFFKILFSNGVLSVSLGILKFHSFKGTMVKYLQTKYKHWILSR